MNTDDKIRAILQMEADAVEPSASGFEAIRDGIDARRRRTWWVRGGLFAGTAVATAAALVLVVADPSPRSVDQGPATPGPSTSPTASPSPASTPTVVAQPDSEPLGTVWPLTTWGELRAWEKDRGTYPSLATASASALAFARNYLLSPDATVASSDVQGATLFFEMRRGDLVVSTLELRRFGDPATGPFLVTRATSEALTIDTTAATAASPIRASGTYKAVDPSILVRLRADGPGSAPIELGDDRAVTSPPNVWSAELAYTTTATNGSLMVTLGSLRDEGIAAAAVVPLRLAPSAAPVGDTFAGIRKNRVAVFRPDGTFVRFLTDALPGGGPSAPDVSPDGTKVAWSQGTGTCSSTAVYAPVGGGTPVTIDGGDGVASLPRWVGNGKIAYARTTCGSAEVHEVMLYDVASKTSTSLDVPRNAPTSLAASPDGAWLAWIVDDTLTTFHLGSGSPTVVEGTDGCTWRAVDIAGTTTTGMPILVTAETCPAPSAVIVNRFASNAPDRDRVAEVKHDAAAYWVSFDAASATLIVSHGLEDGEPYAELIGREPPVRTVRDVDQVSW